MAIKIYEPAESTRYSTYKAFGSGSLKVTPGILHSVTIEEVGAAGSLRFYDDLPAAVALKASIGVFTNAAGAVNPATHILNIAFGTAICFNVNGSFSFFASYK